MPGIEAKLSGDTEKLLKKLNRLTNLDKKGAMTTIAESLRTSTTERFDDAKGPDGRAWKQSIRASEQGGKPLTDTGKLKNSIRAKADSTSAAIGTNDIRAATHQFGDTRTIRAKNKPYLAFQVNGKWRRVKEVTIHIPARPFLGVSPEDEKEIQGTILDLLEES